MRTRSELLERLRSGDVPDILIVGGGINGVGVFRDLAAQGIPALLVEAGDFASGTSAAPSRLIHGGLRYLETGEGSLVKESLIERNLLLKNACHVVHPQPIWVPLKSRFAGAASAVARFLRLTTKPGPKGAVPVKIGLVVYDIFGRKHQTMPNHRMLSGEQARRKVPPLDKEVIAVGEYYDARITHPERLTLELVADAEEDCPEALAIPYLAARELTGGAVQLVDQLGQEAFTVQPKLLINAAGAWVDRVQSGLGFEGRLMGGTRGTHLVLRKPELTQSLGGRMLYFETQDHRACLALPLDDHHIYVGTTDIRTDSPDERRYTEEEVDYIFDVLRPILPGETFSRDEIVFAMAGIRPLPYQNTEVTGQISRDHRIDEHHATEDRPFDTLVLVGGKWTTYRAFAEQVTDKVLKRRAKGRRKNTADLPIGGAKGFPCDDDGQARWISDLAEETGLSEKRCRTLASRYGAGAAEVAEAEAEDGSALEDLTEYTPAELRHICRTERVNRLQDIVLRRTLMGFEGLATEDRIRRIADLAASELGWDGEKTDAEIADTIALLRDEHRVPL